MTVLTWDNSSERLYEFGVDRGVFYPTTGAGKVWNGLISVEESPSGGEVEPLYYDGVKYLDLLGGIDFQATLNAYAAPQGFAAYEGRATLAPGLFAPNQPRLRFGFSYRTMIGNDTDGDSYGYKLHLVYNVLAVQQPRTNASDAEAPVPVSLSYILDAVPPAATTYKPVARLIVDSTKTNSTKLATLENLLYGTVSTNAALPTQATVITTLT